MNYNKANLRDLIAATGLAILLKLDSNHRFFSLYDLEIFLWMTSKNNRAPLVYYIKLCASFQSHQGIGTGVRVRKPSVWVKMDDFLSGVTLKFDNRHLFYAVFKLCVSFHRHQWIQTWITVQRRSMRVKNRQFFVPCDLEISWMTLKNNRAPLLHYTMLYASLCSHWWIQTGVTVWKHPNWVKINDFFYPHDLEIWQMILKNNRAFLLNNIKLCASFHYHMWIQTGVMVWNRVSWVLISVTLTFDLWPWPFAWTSHLSLVITPRNFMMIWWWEHSQKVGTDRLTDGLNHS